MIAVTLIIDSQNSTSPKSRTEIRLAPKSTTRKPSAAIHCGTAYHQ